jgi:adenylosuccinate lyase
VLLALINKGLSRQKAYELVQRNATKTLKSNKKFVTLLEADPEVRAVLSHEELLQNFDEQYYLRYIDDIFKRLGLTEAQWKREMSKPADLKPRSI